MKSARDDAPLAIPPALLAQIRAAAEEEHRPAADLLRDLIEHGLEERRWQTQAAKELQRARELGLPEAADEFPMTDEDRQTIREKIAQGARSLREGRVADGEAFMAQMDAELAELEQQGQ